MPERHPEIELITNRMIARSADAAEQQATKQHGLAQKHTTTACALKEEMTLRSPMARARRAITHAVRASIPSPKPAARRRACHVVRGASARRTSGKRVRPVSAVVRPARPGRASEAGSGMFRSVTIASLVAATRPEIAERDGAHH
ncbi:hypothetical protein ACWEF9_09090 [Streptomyces sp. NPDC004980]